MNREDLTALIGLVVMILGVALYVKLPADIKVVGDIVVLIGFSIQSFRNFKQFKSPIVGVSLSILTTLMTVSFIIILYNKVSFFRDYSLVFVATIGLIIPSLVARLLKVVYKSD